MKIDWQVPAARAGYKGKLDKLIGPGATRAEKDVQTYIPFIAAGILAYFVYQAGLDWSWAQYFVAILLTVDMVGGVITNATSSAKRWYHREGEGFVQHMSFISIHFIQLAVFSYFFLELNVWWIAYVGAYMLLASAAILLTPLYLQRPIALILYSVSLILSLYVFETAVGLEWFLPVFYLKLLISHILREEPYRPEHESSKDA
ncbi:membrane protein [Marinomonas sp. S3726]|uniref:hypothetical protein n=1 Tax=Marinomonas sp. S3726 TaxID=579484 RepID=UPI0005FA3F39|nr:hypothetical protein [Marinomonas sp. S3726]KJZ14874.1 membrane protein [Marinomonas sp. S3726]